jgi:hypothetical protein
MTPNASGRTLLLVRRKGIMSTIPEMWKEECGVREDDTNIVIVIIAVELIAIICILRIIFILRLVLPLALGPCLAKIYLTIRTACRPISILYNLIEVSPKSTSPSEPPVDPSVSCTIL